MAEVIDFVGHNYITLLVLIILGIFSLVSYLMSIKEQNEKIQGDRKITQLSNHEYKTIKNNSDSALINTTVSFGEALCKNKDEIDDMYSRTILVGNRIISSKCSNVKISSVRKI